MDAPIEGSSFAFGENNEGELIADISIEQSLAKIIKEVVSSSPELK